MSAADVTAVLAAAPPYDLEAEMAFLGAMLQKPDILNIGLAELEAGDFFRPEHADLFRLTREIAHGLEADERLDIVTVCGALRAAGLYERIGGQAYLMALVDACPAPSNIRRYAKIVRDKAALRRTVNAATEVLRAASKPNADPGAVLDAWEAKREEVVRRASAKDGGPAPGDATAILTCLADVKAERLRWLWPGRIPQGKATLLCSDPGLGKTLVTLDVTARKSRGMCWPDLPDVRAEVGSVILLSAEDDVSDTIAPRLMAAGADLRRIVLLQGVEYAHGGKGHFNLAHDLPALEDAIRRTPDVRLVVLDPVSAYLGGTDSHKNAEMRGLLAPLSDVAARHGVAILAVTHLNKAGGGRAMYRAMGSLAFIAMARAAWLVVADAADPKRRLMLSLKSNLAEEPAGLAYRILPVMLDGIGPVPRIDWESVSVLQTADAALAAAAVDPENRTAMESAAEWLAEALAGGPVKVADLRQEAKNAGMAWVTVRRAQKTAGAKTRKQGFGAEGAWYWFLPDHAPEDAQHPDLSTLA